MISSCELAGKILLTPSVMYMTTTYPVQKPIAIRVSIDPETKTVAWDDTGRGHSVTFKSYNMEKHRFKVISEDGFMWEFVPLTIEIFNRIKNQLVKINKDFNSDQELQNYYSKTNFQ